MLSQSEKNTKNVSNKKIYYERAQYTQTSRLAAKRKHRTENSTVEEEEGKNDKKNNKEEKMEFSYTYDKIQITNFF